MTPAEGAAAMLNSEHALAMLAKRYPAPEWALMREVAPATGGGTRYADAIAVNLWSSRGHAIHGFEIKVSRSDWLRELKQPQKADELCRNCDHWWIVAPRGVVKDGELPPTWGLLDLRETGLVQAVGAAKLEAAPLTRAFFASLMRRSYERIEEIARRRYYERLQEADQKREERINDEVARRTMDHDRMVKTVAEFEAATGLRLDYWAGPPIATVRLAQALMDSGRYGHPGKILTDLAGDLEKAAAAVREAVKKAALEPPPKVETT